MRRVVHGDGSATVTLLGQLPGCGLLMCAVLAQWRPWGAGFHAAARPRKFEHVSSSQQHRSNMNVPT